MIFDWQCPCPECNGRRPDAPDEREEYHEPEHPENMSPERMGYEGEAARLPRPRDPLAGCMHGWG